jgi:alpha-methylacyl-CoA racemase
MNEVSAGGPLSGLRFIEMTGIGPVPFAVMLLSHFGAEVNRIDRPLGKQLRCDPVKEIVNRGRRSIAVDLSDPRGTAVALCLIE